MLIALLAAYFFSSGAFDFGEFIADTQGRVQTVVSDGNRRDEAIEVTEQMLNATERYRDERLNLLQNSEAMLAIDRDQQHQILLDLFEQMDAQNARHAESIVDLRFTLTQSLTEQEWADLFH